jgi:tetrahydromethanopterin S-methyltransferase subunit G
MDDLTNKSIKIENYEATLTSGDLINIIQHSVTRDDMESLRKEFKADFNKLDSRIEKLDSKIDIVAEKLDSKIDIVAEKLDSKIDLLRSDLSNKIDSNFKWLAGIMIAGILVPIAIHFLTLPH